MSYLELKNISKSFASNRVLTDINLDFRKGEIHSIIGENGAGKSTLMKIIGGIYSADTGEIYINGELQEIDSPIKAFKQGVGIVHQELSIADNMSVAQNIFINNEPTDKLGFIDWTKLYSMTEEALKKIGSLNVDPRARAGNYSVGVQQMIEITKVLTQDVNILILDEPTSALSDNEIHNLMNLLYGLQAHGVTIIFISHKLNEVMEISDRISVLRDGVCTGTLNKDEFDEQLIISMMVGRNIEHLYPEKSAYADISPAIEVRNLKRQGKFSDVNFDINYGEITGMFGLVGAGRTEVAFSIFGADTFDEGTICFDGKEVAYKSPKQALKNGICYLSEDRKNKGLFMHLTVRENTIVNCLREISSALDFIDLQKSKDITENYIKDLNIVPSNSSEKLISKLSGGNQQKVLFAKSLTTKPKVLIVDEPTKGVDVGAKAMIHQMLRELSDQGMAILMISSDLPEVLGVSDNVVVMHEGVTKGTLKNMNLSEEDIMNLAFKSEDV